MFGRRKATILNNDPVLSEDTQQNIIVGLLEVVNTIKKTLQTITPTEREELGKWIQTIGTGLVSKFMGEALKAGGDMTEIDVLSPLRATAANSPFLQRIIAAFGVSNGNDKNGPS